MESISQNDAIIPQEKAMEIARNYLRDRYYNSDQIIFKDCELLITDEFSIYRFNGLMVEKSRSFIDRLARDKSAVTFKFMIDIGSKDGKVLNYIIH